VSSESWPDSLESLAQRHRAAWAIEFRTGALEDLMDRLGERLRPDQDLLGQMLLMVGLLRELEVEGRLTTWPWRLQQWRLPSERLLVRALDSVCPEGKVIVLGVFDSEELLTCLAARRSAAGFDYLLGPEELRSAMGLLSGDWTRDYRHLVRAVEARLGPIAVGCFGEYQTLRDLAEHSRPGAWVEAVAARDIIVSPLTPALAIPLSVDAGRAALAALRQLAERSGANNWFGPESPFLPVLQRLERVPLFDRDLTKVFGYDLPLLLEKLRGRGRGHD
jgi:hypothetical protein